MKNITITFLFLSSILFLGAYRRAESHVIWSKILNAEKVVGCGVIGNKSGIVHVEEDNGSKFKIDQKTMLKVEHIELNPNSRYILILGTKKCGRYKLYRSSQKMLVLRDSLIIATELLKPLGSYGFENYENYYPSFPDGANIGYKMSVKDFWEFVDFIKCYDRGERKVPIHFSEHEKLYSSIEKSMDDRLN